MPARKPVSGYRVTAASWGNLVLFGEDYSASDSGIKEADDSYFVHVCVCDEPNGGWYGRA